MGSSDRQRPRARGCRRARIEQERRAAGIALHEFHRVAARRGGFHTATDESASERSIPAATASCAAASARCASRLAFQLSARTTSNPASATKTNSAEATSTSTSVKPASLGIFTRRATQSRRSTNRSCPQTRCRRPRGVVVGDPDHRIDRTKVRRVLLIGRVVAAVAVAAGSPGERTAQRQSTGLRRCSRHRHRSHRWRTASMYAPKRRSRWRNTAR